ncbi:hypothetical protein ACFX13_035008 [Malus domestica]
MKRRKSWKYSLYQPMVTTTLIMPSPLNPTQNHKLHPTTQATNIKKKVMEVSKKWYGEPCCSHYHLPQHKEELKILQAENRRMRKSHEKKQGP